MSGSTHQLGEHATPPAPIRFQRKMKADFSAHVNSYQEADAAACAKPASHDTPKGRNGFSHRRFYNPIIGLAIQQDFVAYI